MHNHKTKQYYHSANYKMVVARVVAGNMCKKQSIFNSL